MRFLSVSFILLFLISCCFAATSDWQGAWSDNCPNKCVGGILYLCVNGFDIEGTFSDIGHLTGTISRTGLTVTGKWVEAGFTDYTSGGFEWRMDVNTKQFTGEWWYDGFECVRFRWNSLKLNDLKGGESTKCRQLISSAGSTALQGTYRNQDNDFMYVCVDDNSDTVRASYVIDGQQYFTIGNLGLKNRVAMASTWYDGGSVSPNPAIELLMLTGSGKLTQLFWNVPHSQSALSLYSQITLHSIGQWSLVSPTVTQADCDSSLGPLGNVTTNLDDWNGGVWLEDKYGGRLYTCSDGLNVWGTYAEIGWFVGKIDINSTTVTGVWYEAGSREVDSGTFEWDIAPSQIRFRGAYLINASTKPQTVWGATRLDVGSGFDNDQCWTLASSISNQTILGSWFYGPSTSDILDCCEWAGDYANDTYVTKLANITGYTGVECSYEKENGERGYVLGYLHDDGQSMQNTWYEETTTGISFARMTDDAFSGSAPGDVLTQSWWRMTNTDKFAFEPCSSDTTPSQLYFGDHVIREYIRAPRRFVVDQSVCARNAYLFNYKRHNSPEAETISVGGRSSSSGGSASGASRSVQPNSMVLIGCVTLLAAVFGCAFSLL